ncbi:MAG TPA: ComEC/Rec2 family competence protein [Bryobacteraceae bacterium]|jgi:competence protein ComEC
MAPNRDPLIPPLAAVVAGILLGQGLPFSVRQSAWPIAAFLFLAICARAAQPPALPTVLRPTNSDAGGRGARDKIACPTVFSRGDGLKRLRNACILLALVFAGTLDLALHQPPPPPEIDAGFRETVLLDGCVVEPTVFSPGREQFTLELADKARARVSLPLEDDPAVLQKLTYGQLVEIEARVRSPHNFNNPGGFDYTAYLARQNIFWTVSMSPRASQATILPGRCGSRFMGVVFALRTAALERLDQLYAGDSYNTGMMEAILIGESSSLVRVWTEDFRRTGTFHALVISGIHVTVLAGVLLFLLRMCAVPELPALAMTAAAAWLYALVSGFSAPVVRAAGGFSLFLIARFLFRRTRVMNLLAAVALIYLAWDPAALFDASFQLSFLSVAAIGALAAPLLQPRIIPLARGMRALNDVERDVHLAPHVAQARLEFRLVAEILTLWARVPQRWAEEIVGMLARLAFFMLEMAVISSVIQIGLALPMAEYFHRVSFTGLTANLLIGPLLEAVVPLGFAAVFTHSTWIAALAGWLLHLSAKIAAWHAAIEPSWRVPDPPVWLAMALAISLILLAALPRRRMLWVPAGTIVLGLFVLLVWHPWPAQALPHQLELTSIDVGQGDSLLLMFPGGARMLVDGGGLLQFGTPRKSNLDIGEDVVSPYLWTRGIKTLDVVVATHAHEDHIGGLPAILENFRPKELWVGANPPERLEELARKLGIRVLDRRLGPPFEFSGATIQIVSPPEDYTAAKLGNNDSLAFRVSFGSRSFLLTGDMEKPMEAALLGEGLAEHADVLKVGHHGSKTSSIPPFLDAVSPEIAIISAGYENSFGHPHPDVIKRLEDRHAIVLRTDLDGLVSVSTDGKRLWFDEMAWQSTAGAGSPVFWYPLGGDLVQ